MNRTFPILLLLVFLFSCKENNPGRELELCGVTDPVNNLPWLRDKIAETKKNKEDKFTTITALKLGNDPVINIYMSYMSCLGCNSYKCDGTLVDPRDYSEEEYKRYMEDLLGEKGERVVLWPVK